MWRPWGTSGDQVAAMLAAANCADPFGPPQEIAETIARETLADQELLDAAEQVTVAVAVHRPDAADVVGVDLKDVRAG